jgi:DNA-binding transcriptional ArsR family regulator
MPTDDAPDSNTARLHDPASVAIARESMFEGGDAAQLADRFKLLSDPGRIGILSALAAVGTMCVCDLAAAVGATESATSHQLKQLRLGGLVRSEKRGRSMFYSVDDDHVRSILNLAAAHYLPEDPETS